MEGIPGLASVIYVSRTTLDHRMRSSAPKRSNFGPAGTSPRWIASNKSNKRRKTWAETQVIVENDLSQLCRDGEWASAIRRCRSNPEEAIPKPVAETDSFRNLYSNTSKLGVNGKFFEFDENETIYWDTPLGIACASNQVDTDAFQEVIVALVMACPEQVRASQSIPGHTPLRAAILNPRCSPFVLRELLDAEAMCQKSGVEGRSVFSKKDRNGHRPVDHIIMGLQLGSSSRSIDIFKQYIEYDTFHMSLEGDREDLECSPLIRLLGTRSIPCDATNQDKGRLERVLECANLLLERDSLSFTTMSKLTGCSVIHIALRNYGNYAPLINTLISRSGAKKLMAHRNCFGDLPLHVACSVGVPYNVLRTIVRATVGPVLVDKGGPLSTHPLLWSTNYSGHTAADLEWVRHIESGHGLDSVRSLYPTSGVKRHSIKHDDYYQDLLREAVDHVLLHNPQALSSCVLQIFGAVIERISLLLTETSLSFASPRGRTLLHDVCALSSPGTPTLRGPLVRLFLSLYKHELLARDKCGMIPLHYLVQHRGGSIDDVGSWKDHIFEYLKLEPDALRVATREGRLPLQILLDHTTNLDIVHEMVARFPESVDCPDPTTNLVPFLLAARNSYANLDVIFFLLRHSPSRCPPWGKAGRS